MSASKIASSAMIAGKTPAKPAKDPAAKASRKRAPVLAPKPYHHGSLRDCLLEAADRVLITHGASGITLREVAKAAGVSHAAPYHHFASLDDMLATVAERGFQRLSAAMAPSAQITDSRERLLQISEAYVNCARAYPSQFRLMFGPLLSRKREFPAFQAASEQAFAMLLAAASAHDAEHGPELALLGWSLSHGLSNLLIDGAFDSLPMALPSAKALTRQLAQRALGGIGGGNGGSDG